MQGFLKSNEEWVWNKHGEEHKFFLSLQIEQDNKGSFINQQKYTKEILKKFKMEDA